MYNKFYFRYNEVNHIAIYKHTDDDIDIKNFT